MSTQRYECRRTATIGERSLEYTFALDLAPVHTRARVEVGTAGVLSYVADVPASEGAARPVVFLFNGGPGSSSAFLHLSGIGPRRATIPEDLSRGTLPPYELEDSDHSILDVADLVFLDPVNTGYGRLLHDADTSEPYSVEGDARYLAAGIRRWVSSNDRWNSPKYLLGESYGTHRAPFLAAALMDHFSIAVDGIVLLGQALNVQETLERPGNLTGAITSLPFRAATAWYHGVGSTEHESVEEAVDAAVEFAFGEFATAMLQGNRLVDPQRTRLARRLEKITGIPRQTYLDNRFWISKPDFCRELLSTRGLVLGRNDSRYTARAANRSTGEFEIEPSHTHTFPGYASGIARLGRELGVPPEQEYLLIDAEAANTWDWSDGASSSFLQFGKPSPFQTYPYPSRLTQYLKRVPAARLFIGTGVYDPLTTVGAVEHLLREFDLPLDRVTSRRYHGGHMHYTDPASARRLTADLRAFLGPA